MTSNARFRRLIRLSASQVGKVKRLLDMEYTLTEIEKETTIQQRVLSRLIRDHNLPARKSENGRYWIHGLTFAKWALEETKKKRPVTSLQPDQYYCFKCKIIMSVKTRPEVKHYPYWDYLTNLCPVCGSKVGKAAKRDDHGKS